MMNKIKNNYIATIKHIYCSIGLASLMLCYPSGGLSMMYHMPSQGDVIGETLIITAEPGKSLYEYAAQYNVGKNEIIAANKHLKYRSRLRSGAMIVLPIKHILPSIRQGIVINLPELRIYYFTPDGKYVHTYPIGVGRAGWRTPTFTSKVHKKKEAPTWHVPQSIQDYTFERTGRELPDKVLPGPENPLGTHAIYLNKSGYLIHGTNAPHQIGTYISSGCIRMYNENVAELFAITDIGTMVHIINNPYKAGWQGNTLYFEAHKPLEDYNSNEVYTNSAYDILNQNITQGNQFNQTIAINWDHSFKAIQQQQGIPIIIGRK